MKSVESFVVLGIVSAIAVVVIVIKVWFFGSLITSSVKAISKDCASTYAVEGIIISGNWFCSSEEK